MRQDAVTLRDRDVDAVLAAAVVAESALQTESEIAPDENGVVDTSDDRGATPSRVVAGQCEYGQAALVSSASFTVDVGGGAPFASP